jgi:hypothetical protein
MIFHTLKVLNLKVGDEIISTHLTDTNRHTIIEIKTDTYMYKTSDGNCYNIYGFYANSEFAEIILRTASAIKNLICNRVDRITPV